MSADGQGRGFVADLSGSTAVETAFALPILILMLLAGMQFGLAQHSASSLSFAMEKGARALVLQPTMTETALRTKVLSYLSDDLDSKVTVNLTTGTVGGETVATITGVYTTQIGLPAMASLPFSATRIVKTPLP